jgi:hypothetical protein
MLPPPEGMWGMPPEVLQTLPSCDPEVAKNRAEAREITETFGYGPNGRLQVKLITRNIPAYRDPAVHGQQHLPRLADGRRLARQLAHGRRRGYGIVSKSVVWA